MKKLEMGSRISESRRAHRSFLSCSRCSDTPFRSLMPSCSNSVRQALRVCWRGFGKFNIVLLRHNASSVKVSVFQSSAAIVEESYDIASSLP